MDGRRTVLVLAWTAALALDLVSAVFLPSPAAVLSKLLQVSTTGFMDATLWGHLVASLARVFAALGVSAVVGIPVGLAIGLSTIGRDVFDPLLEFLRPIPPLAYLSLVVIWFGIGEPSKVLVIAIAMVAPIAISTAAGVRGVRQDKVNAARSFGATRAERAALDPHRHPHRARRRLDDARRGDAWAGLHDPVGRAVPGHRCRDDGNRGDCGDRLRARILDPLVRASCRALGRPRLKRQRSRRLVVVAKSWPLLVD